MKVTPRPYQREAVRAALKGLRGRSMRALVVLATGLGKTLTAALIAEKLRSKRVLFLVHNNFILDHAVEEFRHVFNGTNMATFNGFSKDGVASADIVFATWQTMGKHLKLWKRNHFDLIIVDEAHHTEADTYRPVIDYFVGRRLGITATPDRVDEADIREVFGREVVNVTLEEAVARGWLPRIEYHVITDESLDENTLQKIAEEIREGKKRFTMAEVNRRIFIHKRDSEIARIIDGYPEKSIVFCASIKHAERIRRSLKISAVFHSETGKTSKRTWDKNQRTLAALKNGIVRRVCAVNAFNEGVNVPTVGLVAFCRVTGSLTIFRQQLGRGLRPGKDKLIVLDFVGNLERIQLVLEMMNRISDLHECYVSEAERKREGYERQQFEVSGKGFEFTFSDQVVDLMKVLEGCTAEPYVTWQEASRASIRLGFKTVGEYRKGYKQDLHLPSRPAYTYQDFPGWRVFLGGSDLNHYSTWQEASKAAQRLKSKTWADYRRKRRTDPRLPANPDQTYRDFPGADAFFGRPRGKDGIYSTWQEASKAARKLGMKNWTVYRAKYSTDPRLPSNPHGCYKDFPGANKFFGK
jgi:superfamily II DNA or RNA helicase